MFSFTLAHLDPRIFTQTSPLEKTPKLRKFWNLIKKNDEKMDEEARMQAYRERRFLSQLIQKFISVLKSIPVSGPISMDKVHYSPSPAL